MRVALDGCQGLAHGRFDGLPEGVEIGPLRELRDTARAADDIARVMSMRMDQTDRPWVVASEVIGGLAHELRELSAVSAKLSHEASLVERIEKLAYGKMDDEPHVRQAPPPKRPQTLSS